MTAAERQRREVVELLISGRWYEDLSVLIFEDEKPPRAWGRVVRMGADDGDHLWEVGPVYFDAQIDRDRARDHLRRCCALWIVDYLEVDGTERTVTPRAANAEKAARQAARGTGVQPPEADSPHPSRVEPAAVRGEFEAQNPPDNLPGALRDAARWHEALGRSCAAISEAIGTTDHGIERLAGRALRSAEMALGALLRHALVSTRTSRESVEGAPARGAERDLRAQDVPAVRLTRAPGSHCPGSHWDRLTRAPGSHWDAYCAACNTRFPSDQGYIDGDLCPRCNAWRKAAGKWP